MVEAFSVRGLGLLAASWETNPPFAGDSAFAAAIRQYRQNLIVKYQKDDGQQAARPNIAEWFHAYRNTLEAGGSRPAGTAVLAILNEMERDKACVEDLGAVNRWPARTGVLLEEYLNLWETSCKEVGASGRLPARLRSLMRLS